MFCIMSLEVNHITDPNLLQLSARPWLYELGLKKLNQVPDSVLDDIKNRGINAIYFLGTWKLGPYGLQHDKTDQGLLNSFRQTLPDFSMDDVIGSPFAVYEYEMNSNEIGTDADLQTFRNRLASRKIALYLDFVPNHSAIDAPQVTSSPKLFVKDVFRDGNQQYKNGIYFGKDKYGNVWTDTLQFNYFNPDTVTARINDLKKMARVSDGARCDMAMLALNDEIEGIWGSIIKKQGYNRPSEEFWTRAIREVKAVNPNFKFMAEVYWGYGDRLVSMGFDFVYDKEGLYDSLSSGDLNGIKNYITGRGDKMDKGTHFVENHDEGRAAEHFGSNHRANAAGLVSFTLPGMRFHFQGQWEGRRNKLDIHLRRSFNQQHDKDDATIQLYKKLTPLLNDDVWHGGQWSYKNVFSSNDAWRLMAWTWSKGTSKVLVVVNYSDKQASGAIRVDVPNGAIAFKEQLSGQTYMRDGQEVREKGIYCVIQQWDAQIFYY